jgi:hypothetical protein
MAAHYLIGHLSYSQVPALAKRHKVEANKDSVSGQDVLVKQVGTYDEAGLCKLLLEISLLDSAYQRSTVGRDDVLMDAAKRYRVDAEKLQKAVAEELAAKRDKRRKPEQSRRSARRHRPIPLASIFIELDRVQRCQRAKSLPVEPSFLEETGSARISGTFRFGLREHFLAFRMRVFFRRRFPSSHSARGLRGPWPAAWMMVKRLAPGR